jgi:GNAT superfamily N-acetyltransferase
VLPDHALTLDDVRSYLEAVVEHVDLLALEDGRPVGTASVTVEPNRAHPLLRLIVRPEARRRGIGTALFDRIAAWAGEHGYEQIDAWVDDEQREGLAFAAARGFAEISHELKVALDLRHHEPPPVDPPPGIEIVTWAERPDVVRGLYEVACEAGPDIPGTSHDAMEPFEDWLAHDMSGSGDRPEWTFVALAGDDVVGYAKFSLTEAQPHTAFHDLTGVKRAWRGRGIAGALKRTQIRWAKDNGYERVVTNNEERNEPIRRLNERLGYRPALGRRLLRGPLAK